MDSIAYQHGAIRSDRDPCAQVAVGCGTICTFHVGGAPSDGESCCARWEFFIGDRPHCAGLSIDESSTERQPMDQIASIEHFLDPGEVAISSEVAQQVQLLPSCMHACCLRGMFLDSSVSGLRMFSMPAARSDASWWSGHNHVQHCGAGEWDVGPAATALVRLQAARPLGA